MKKLIMTAVAIGLGTIALADTPASILKSYEAEAGAAGSVARGQDLFMSQHTGGKPDTPSCTTCHTSNLKASGQTRVGKTIGPMAVSANPESLTDAAFAAKWLRRNCKSVLGRECDAQEKADIIAYLMSL